MEKNSIQKELLKAKINKTNFYEKKIWNFLSVKKE